MSIVAFLTLGVAKVGCKKTDTGSVKEVVTNQTIVAKFFEGSSNVSHSVLQVVEKLKTLNKQNPTLIPAIVAKSGYPVWNKAITNINEQATIIGRITTSENDTIVYIPFVQVNDTIVDAFIQATITDTVQLSLSQNSSYSNYTFGGLDVVNNTAEKVAFKFMELNNKVFNYKSFEIKDKRLFHQSNNYSDTSNLKIIVRVKNDSTNNNGRLAIANFCATVIITTTNHHCPYPKNQCPNIYTGVLGPCDNCETSCATTSSTYQDLCQEGGSGGGSITGGFSLGSGPANGTPNGLGGGTGGGTSGSSSGGGLGWIPLLEEDNYLISNETMSNYYMDLDNTNSNFTDNTLAKPRPSFSQMKANTLPPDLPTAPFKWYDVADTIGGEVKTQLYLSGQQNTCATRISYALNRCSNGTIPNKSYTFDGANGKKYILGALTMLTYLKQSYGTDTSNTIHLENTLANPNLLTETYIKSKLLGKKGIYVLIPKDQSVATGFGATGHVDLLDTDGSFSSGHSYWDSKGGVKEVYLFILN